MLQEALEYIRDLSAESFTPRIVEIPGDERKLLVADSSGVKEREIPPPLRNHQVSTVEDLAALATEATSEVNGECAPCKPSLWHHFTEVRLLWNDADRRDRATLPLVYTDEWNMLVKLQKQNQFDQKQMIRLLRIELANCLSLPSLITSLRKIKFRSASSGEGNIQHGNESLGRQVEAEVSGIDGGIPEQVTLQVRVYQNFGEDERWPVRCDLEIDPHEQKFTFRPLPADVQESQLLAQGSIRQRLQAAVGKQVPVYFGSP